MTIDKSTLTIESMKPDDYLGITNTAARWGVTRQRVLQLLPRIPQRHRRTIDGRVYIHVDATKPSVRKPGRKKSDSQSQKSTA